MTPEIAQYLRDLAAWYTAEVNRVLNTAGGGSSTQSGGSGGVGDPPKPPV